VPESVLEISLSTETSTTSLMVAGTEVELAAFKFKVDGGEDVELDQIYLTQIIRDSIYANYKDYDAIWFEDEDGVEIAGTRMTPTSSFPMIRFDRNAFVVDNDDINGQILYLKAQLASVGVGYNGVSGHFLGYRIYNPEDVSATGFASGNDVETVFDYSGLGAPVGSIHYVYKAIPFVDGLDVRSTRLANGTNELLRFRIGAVGDDISIYKNKFQIYSTEEVSVSNLYLYDVTGGFEMQVNSTAGDLEGGEFWATEGDDWFINFPFGEILIREHSPRTFVLRGDITGVTTGSVVHSTLMVEDTWHIALMDTAERISLNYPSNFVWSDMNSFSHSTSSADWTNGHRVSARSVNGTLAY
jgi:hypothetical protein